MARDGAIKNFGSELVITPNMDWNDLWCPVSIFSLFPNVITNQAIVMELFSQWRQFVAKKTQTGCPCCIIRRYLNKIKWWLIDIYDNNMYEQSPVTYS